MKHLLCEHQNTISELKANSLTSTEVLQKEQDQLEAELHKDMRDILVDMQELSNENLVKELELVCSIHQVLDSSISSLTQYISESINASLFI